MDFDGLSPRVPWKPFLPDELFCLNKNEVFVDCGAFDGDTLRDFLFERGSEFQQYFAIEPDPVNFQKIEIFLETLDPGVREKIFPRSLALSSNSGMLRFNASGTAQSSLSASGDLAIQSARIDDLFQEARPTYIKMDIEGAEEDALRGAENIISKFAPVLAISVYHRFDDLWQLPMLIDSFSESYRFHLRPHADPFWDLVCYAVPSHRRLD
jgi:FkbM family methyltransferase